MPIHSVTSRCEKEPIAIIGMGCRFPGGVKDPASFWHVLSNGVDAITEVPADRWNIEKYYHPEPGMPGKTYSRWGGFIPGIQQFEPECFGISPREAAFMDPQQRLLLEVVWEALEDGGQVIEQLAGSQTGVFVGISTADYSQIMTSPRDVGIVDAHVATGGATSIAANRLSYCFDLRGPSVAVDTACSSSLVATHLACQSIWRGECDLALAGGVNVILTPGCFIAFCAASMLSPEGRCKAFDASADGFVRSEGAGVIVLKPLTKALADRDPIYCLILASAVNQDGRTSGISAPSQIAQEELLREACRQAGIDPHEIDYVEAHGTGTKVGDPIEAKALGTVLSADRPQEKPCLIGSVKTNLGHLEAASGIAGAIKVALALKKRQIPANLHFRDPNPDIPFEDLRLRVPCSLEPWPQRSRPALAGVNSFGFGGTNAHLVMKEYRHEPDGQGTTAQDTFPQALLLPLSARSPEALRTLVQSYQEFVGHNGEQRETSLSGICSTASVRRMHLDHRLSLVFRSREELRERLDAFLAGENRPGTFIGRRVYGKTPQLAFVFSGQGSQWWGMGRELLEGESVFRRAIEECDALLRKYADWSLWEELTADEQRSRLQETSIAQPALFALQVALAALWKSWGVEPQAVVGHSVGEVAAAYIAGVLSLEEAARVIFHRGRCMDLASSRGKMLAVGLSCSEAEDAIRGYEAHVSLAATNGPSSATLSGDPQALEQIYQVLDRKGVFCRFLKVNYAFHSPQMDPLKDELLKALRGLDPQAPVLPMISTVTGKPSEGRQLDANYWWRNVRERVRFAEAVDELIEREDCDVFVELSPHPVLSGAVSECLLHRSRKGTVLPSLRRQEKEQALMLASLGALYTLGHPVDWQRLWPNTGQCLHLPTYPWQRQSYWHESEEVRELRLGKNTYPLLGQKLRSAKPTWEMAVDKRLLRYLNDHKVHEHVVLPAAAYVEMALEAARENFPGEGALVLEDLQLQRALFLPEAPAIVQLIFDPADSSFAIHSTPSRSDQSWVLHTTGYIRTEVAAAALEKAEVQTIKWNLPEEVAQTEVYRTFAEVGLHFGPSFQGVEQVWRKDEEALGLVRLSEVIVPESEPYCFHPALLDACFQVLSQALPQQESAAHKALYLPVQIERVRFYRSPGPQVWSHVHLTRKSARMIEGDLRVYDEDGNLLIEIEGFRCQAMESTRSGATEDLEQWFYETKWYHKPLPQQLQAQRSAQYFPPASEIADSVANEMRQLDEEMSWPTMLPRAQKALDTLATAYIAQALYDLGWRGQAGDRLTVDVLMEQLHLASQHRQVLRRFMLMLEQAGFLKHVGTDAWLVDHPFPEQDLPRLWQQALSRHSAFLAELSLIHSCGSHLAAVLRGEQDPLQLLFPEGSTTIAEHFYQDSPSFRPYNIRVQKAVSQVLRRLPPGRTIRILEVGAGTGGMTTYVLPQLPARRTEYVFSDVTPFFFSKAEPRFRHYPFIQFQLLDIDQDPLQQGYEAHSFDLILASSVLHATSSVRDTLHNIRQLLASEGSFILLEVENAPPFWADAVFGLTAGWWRFRDYDLRPDYPLLDRGAWKNVLKETGFTEVASIPPPHEGGSPGVVMVARGPSLPTQFIAQETEPASKKGSWLIFADGGGVAQKLVEQLRAHGDTCFLVTPGGSFQQLEGKNFHIAPDSPEDMQQLLQAVVTESQPTVWRGVIHLWSLDGSSPEQTSVASLQQAEMLGCHSVLHLVQALYQTETPNAFPRLLLVTRGAQAIEQAAVAVSQTSLVGLGRTLINEHPDIRCKMVDLDPGRSAKEISFLLAEIWSEDSEEEVALRQGTRWVPRLERMEQEQVPAGRDGKPFHLEITRPGVLDRLSLRETVRQKPGPGQIEIEVSAASLNFRDVMKALGMYPAESDDALLLGDECAGRVVAVGEGVKDLKVGDEVVAVAPGSFGSHVITLAALAARKPESLSFAEAATLPIAFLTAYYALYSLARIRAGERVLIQSAAGGVGLAAVQIAQQAGAEVFATAGSPEKREMLQILGVPHIMDSRSLSFADQVMEITRGQGADVVLNSLAGQAIGKGLACLAPYGRFLELGKRDIYQNSKLGLWPFRKNVSFFAIDLGGLIGEKPALAHTLLTELWQKVEDGTFRSLPHRVFPVSRIVDAFRHMAQARHVGKIVVSMRDQDTQVEPLAQERIAFRAEATYLITGGLGGLGLRLARWIVEHGGRNLVLMGRSGAVSEEAQKSVEDLQRTGARVMVVTADVSQADQVKEVLTHIDRTMPSLKGVFHAAMVLDDGILLQLDRERFSKVMAPKVEGAWHLHRLTLDKELDLFVLFSSSSSLVGNPGQANYVAANTFLDALAHHRHALALPATTINLGLIKDVGYAARNEKVAEMLERHGILGISAQQALEALGHLLQKKSVQAGVLRIDWPKLAKFMLHRKLPERLSLLASAASAEQSDGGEGERIREALLQVKPDEREELARSYLLKQVAKALGASVDRLDLDRPLNEMGFDSLMAVELKNRVESDLALSLPTRELMQTPTINRLLTVVLTQLGGVKGGTEHTVVATGGVSTHSSPTADSSTACLITLRAQGSRPPLFCLHPAGGQVNIYRNLSELLPADQPVYGIQSRLLAGARKEHSSLEDMALHYAQIICQLQAQGPYSLLGFSLGGFLAMAIANILERQGQKIGFVGLVDCDARWTDPEYPQHLILHDRIVGMYGVLQRDLNILHPLAEDQVGELSAIILSSTPNQRADNVIMWLQERKYLKERIPLVAIRAYLADLLSRFEIHMNLIVGFQPSQIQAPLFVWWARAHQREENASKPSWRGYSREGVVEEILPGDHYEVMSPPVVSRLAEQLDRILRTMRISQAA